MLPVLWDNLNDLNLEKKTANETCLKTIKQTKQESDLIKVCEDRFHKEWYVFDPLLGLSYYYLGEVLNARGEYNSAFHYYGLAIPLLKDPAGIPVETIGLPGDLFLKTERLRLKINLATIYSRMGDEKQFKVTIAETEELASEFQAVEDLVKVKLLKAKFLFQKAKTKTDYQQVIQELELAEKNIFKSYSTLIDLEDGFFQELYVLFESTYFKLGKWKDIHAKEEKLYNILLFKHFQNTRVIFEEAKLEGLNQSFRESIRKDAENNFKYKSLVNSRKPISSFLGSRIEINNEIERIMSVILKFFPEKKRFFEIKDSTMPESLTQSQNIIRLKLIQNNLIVSEIHKGKENFQAITISKDLKSTLESYFTQLLVKTQAKEITIIPDKILATFDFDSLLVRDNKLANQLKINYAFTARQVNPFSHKNIQLTNIVTTTEEKINNEKIENSRFIETRNSKKLGPILNDSDILNTEINYTNGNIFSPSVNGFINLKEFAEKSASISLVVLNKTKFDEKSFFRTIAAVDVIQSTGVPLVLLGSDKKLNPLEMNSYDSINRLDSKPVGFHSEFFTTANSKEYNIVKQEAFKWERKKKYREALQFFLEADSLVSRSNKEEKLESELNLARIKSKAIPKTKRFVFYERLLKKYENAKPEKILIYEALLHQCYINFSNAYCRDHFKNFYKTLKSTTELDTDIKERSKTLVNFYIQINNGAIQNLEKNYQNFLKAVSFDDLFLFHEDMSRFFLKNFIFDKAEFHSKQFLRQATNPEEREIALDLENEIELQSFFTQRSNTINLSEVSDSIYKDAIQKNWKSVDLKMKSIDRKSYDDILIKYRQRLFSIWKDINSGSEYNPLQLISETTSTGKSLYSIMSQVDRTLLFHLLLNSIQYQAQSEVNTVFDAFVDLQREDSRKIQIYYMQMAWVEELFNRGDYQNAEKYLSKLEPDLSKFSYDRNLQKRFHFAKFKILSMTDESGKKLETVNQPVLDSETEWYPYYKEAKFRDITKFVPMLNEILVAKSDKLYDTYNRREFLDFITYLELLSFRSNSSEVFLDLAFYRDKVEDVNRLQKETATFSSLPQAEAIAELLLKKVPKGQEFISVVNFGLQTFTIKIENGKSNGEIAFPDYRSIKNDIYGYHKQVRKKGSGLLLKDYLEPKFRNKILLSKNKLSYLYLSSFYLKAPLELKEEDNFYIVQNPSLLLKRDIKKTSDYFKENYSVKRFKDSIADNRQLSALEDLEIKEIPGNLSPVYISGEKLSLSENEELQFGKNKLYSLTGEDRKGAWFLSNSDLYNTSFYRDDINISLNYLDRIHNGPGVFSLGAQRSPANILFMKTLFQKTELQTNLRIRFIDALRTVKSRYPQEMNWNGYRLYTNTFLEE